MAAQLLLKLVAMIALAACVESLASFKNCDQGTVAIFQSSANCTTKLIYSTFGVPSVMVVRLNKAGLLPDISSLSCAYGPANMSRTLLGLFDGGVADAFGVLVPTVYEFNDHSGSATYSPYSQLQAVSLASMMNNATTADNYTVDVFSPGFVYDFLLAYHGSAGTDSYNPFLPYSAESASLALSISNFTYNGTFSKLAVKIVVASTSADLSLATTKSINDEYTPTVFMRTDLTAGEDAYMFWKPVAYGGTDRDSSNSTFALPGWLDAANTSFFDQSVTSAFLGQAAHMASTVVSFGLKGDQTYNFGFISWSFVIGFGKPVQQGLSASLWATIFVTNGLPLVALVVGTVYLIYKRFPRSKRYTPFNIQR